MWLPLISTHDRPPNFQYSIWAQISARHLANQLAGPSVLSNSSKVLETSDLKEEILEAVTNDAVLKGQLPSDISVTCT